MGDFGQLKVWNRAHALTLRLYTVTANFPKSELFGLTQQIRRASVSIEANLAKGCGRRTDRELSRFALIANGSANELQCQVLVARDLGYVSQQIYGEIEKELAQITSMLSGLVGRLRMSYEQVQEPV